MMKKTILLTIAITILFSNAAQAIVAPVCLEGHPSSIWQFTSTHGINGNLKLPEENRLYCPSPCPFGPWDCPGGDYFEFPVKY